MVNKEKKMRAPVRRRVYNPLRLTDAEVERSYIARQTLFESIFGDIKRETGDRIPQHHLIVGQRGMGKTTLLCRIAAELRKDGFRDDFLPLSFPEEHHIEIDRLSRFWLNCLDAAADALEAEGDRAGAAALDAAIQRWQRSKEAKETLADETRDAFRRAVESTGRRAVLLFDNFNLLLKKLKSHDYVLRGFFTRPGAPVLVGAATVMPEDMQDYGAAFYDSFKTRVLHRLTVDEMREIIARLAGEAGKPEVASRLRAETPRLQVLRDMTGGNPRTAVLLFDLFAQGFSDDPYQDLEALLDQVTPLYQSRLEQLSEQGQLLVSALARHWSPVTAEDLAKLTDITRSSISPQLGRLEDIGLVEKTSLFKTKKTGYQIAERFFNIWYLMRFATRRQRTGLICLTRFLQDFYSPPELAERAGRVLAKSRIASGEAAYALALAEAMQGDYLAHDLRTHTELLVLEQSEGIRERMAEIIDPADISPKVLEFSELKQKLREVVPDDSFLSPDHFVELVLTAFSLVPPVRNPNRYSIAAGGKIDEGGIKKITDLLNKEEQLYEIRYSRPSVQFVKNRLSRGLLTAWNNQEEMISAIEQTKDPNALFILAMFAEVLGAIFEVAESAYRKAVEISPQFVGAWNDLGLLLMHSFKRFDEAEASFRHAIDADPNNPGPWNNLGSLLMFQLNRIEQARAAYEKAIELDATYATPWNGLGTLLADCEHQYKKAEFAFRKATELDGSLASAWDNLGRCLVYQGKFSAAIGAFSQAIELLPAKDAPRHNLAMLLRDVLHDSNGARTVLTDLKERQNWKDTQHLQEALFAAHDDNFGLVKENLRQALRNIDDALPIESRDDWYRATGVLLHLGFGDKLIEFLKDEGADVRLLPWFEAICAHVAGNEKYLRNIPVEARQAAQQIYAAIERWMKLLPEETRKLN